MEKYVDDRALRHFRDKALEVDVQPKIDDLQTKLNNVNDSLTDRIDGLCYVSAGGGSLSTTTVKLPVDGLYSARIVVWLNGQISGIAGDPHFSISVSDTDLVQVSLGDSVGTKASGSIALDIVPVGGSSSFNVVASGCIRVSRDVTLVQNVQAIAASGSPASLAITITPAVTINGAGSGAVGRGYSYSALYNAKSKSSVEVEVA